MSQKLIQEFLRRNNSKQLNIHCVGDAMVDEYYQVKVNRISPEFPMPIMHSVDGDPFSRPGGSANVCFQLNHFNVSKTLVCFLDKKADYIFSTVSGLSMLYGQGPEATLPIKRRFLDSKVQVVRHDIEAPLCGLTQKEVNRYIRSLDIKEQPDVAILSDYNKGFFAANDCNVLDYYRNCITIVDPKKGPLNKWKGCTIFKPNAKEAEELSGKTDWKEQCLYFKANLQCKAVVITHGGSMVCGHVEGEYFKYCPDKKVDVESVVGAGDCFAAFFAMAIGHGFKIPEAAEIAWNAGSVYVQRSMNKPICPSELVEGVIDPEHFGHRNYKLVFCNGCFDVLHEGHMSLLKFAKSKGDKLVVALNSDASVKRLKGAGRPLVPLSQRMAVMSQLKDVDYVVSFDEDTPKEILEIIQPDVLVKGDEYKTSEIVGADKIREVYRAPMVEGISTSKILGDHLQEQF